MALDVVRAAHRDARCVDAIGEELALARGGNATLDAFAGATLDALRASTDDAAARRLAQRVALSIQAALLVRFAPAFVADAFCATRLAGDAFAGGAFGVATIDEAGRIVDRAWPADTAP
jgi:putative acyl-CoA dehydrogenase